MEYLNTNLHEPKLNSSSSILERSQIQILAIGYHLVIIKSKFKKQLKIIVSSLFFNF